MPARLNRQAVTALARAHGLSKRDVIADERTIATWTEPTDDLVAWLSRRHGWCAALTVSYLTLTRVLQRAVEIERRFGGAISSPLNRDD